MTSPEPYSILAVDCLTDWHWITRDVLKNEHVRLTFAESVSEANRYLEEKKFDLVISGYKMPDGVGLNILHLVEDQRLPFILCTSYPREMVPNIAYEKFGYVWKGEIRSLAAEVSRLLGDST